MYYTKVFQVGSEKPCFAPYRDLEESWAEQAGYDSLDDRIKDGYKYETPLLQEVRNNPNKKILCIDLDGTVAVWGNQVGLESLLESGYFANRPAETGLIENIKNANDIIPVVVSAYLTDTPYPLVDKNKWCSKHLPFVNHRIFVPFGANKAWYFEKATGLTITKRFIMLEDYTRALNDFAAKGGQTLKFMNGINGTNGTYAGARIYKEEVDRRSYMLDTILKHEF